MLASVEWGEFKLEELFQITGTKSLDSNAVVFEKVGINFIGRTFENNGIQGKIAPRDFSPNEPNTITATVIGNYKYVHYQKEPYYCSQNINKLKPKKIIEKWNDKIANFLIVNIQKFVSQYNGQQGGYKLFDIKSHKILLPIKNNKIDFDFMENFIAELEAQRIAELEAYLRITGLEDYTLTDEEQKAIECFENIKWKEFNLSNLFGPTSRGKRLKKSDRIPGKLPFITAGEANEGLSSWISNDVYKFSENTITIDMFGSAKYRNYSYGADDHVSVVHTENMSKNTAVFTTTSIHKASYNGQFHYGRNFYPKDADALNIMLPVNNINVDYKYMETFITAIHKLVIKDVVLYTNSKVQATKIVVDNYTEA
ncbi:MULTISPECIES: restriction endonuclease subunit S [unclassified Aerococcus]|uniref:restriction endonuclease subunit S n=1 Tax=unclassified Aerococcus TaxID=2618060 RepID=UPI0008A16052|nr:MULTISPECIES: restriction endonuclease subunit S [unclassified Aerococcus]MDK6679215.1 restriction endonuclease subunit S [Aerococcus sp. UMB8608]MDK6685943.1 restriction endonuclease subunit S [Aerococcus sp. UMB8623]